MSETDALLPVTTTTRQRKTQQVIAARSSVGDTLVEETDGPQISKYGHSHSTFFGEEEYEEGVPRHSTWVHTAFLLLGDIVGTGVLSLAAAFAGFGWIFGILLVVFFALANYHTGTMLHRLCLKHPTAHSYGGLITAVFGDSQLTRIVHKGIYVYLFFFLGDYLMVLALSVQDIFWGWKLCKPIAAAIACGGLLITNQLRTLTHVAIAAVAGFVTIMATIALACALTLARAGMGADIKYVDDDESHPSTQYLVATPSFVRFTMAITSIIFAYDGQKIYPEFISEMANPEDFRKALNVAQPFLCSVYVIVCCVCYAYYGDSAPHYLLDVLNYNWTRTFAGCLMFVHMIISYTITQQVLTRALHLMIFPETANALHPKDEGYVKGTLHWFMISTGLMVGAYVFTVHKSTCGDASPPLLNHGGTRLHWLICAQVFTGLIPFFGQMNSLIGAVFDPLLCFVLPSIMLYKSGLPMTPLDKAGALFYVFVVGVFAWGPGTGVAIYSIAESSDDVGGPFSCQCIAKQCST